MKYIIVDDNNSIYKSIYRELLDTKEYDVKEIRKVNIPLGLNFLHKLHHAFKINNIIKLPLKDLWNPLYGVEQLNWQENEKYCLIILNGALKSHFSKKYLEQFKMKHINVKLVMVIHDSYYRKSMKHVLKKINLFDDIFCFEYDICQKFKYHHFFNLYSIPDEDLKDNEYENDVFFAGMGQDRLEFCQKVFERIATFSNRSKFIICGVANGGQRKINNVCYNSPISYLDEQKYAYNTNCVLEILIPGQIGISLRTCEAICFNKKLITNNKSIKEMPFYDERYIRIIESVEDIDAFFVMSKEKVEYERKDYFSPIQLLKFLEEKYLN